MIIDLEQSSGVIAGENCASASAPEPLPPVSVDGAFSLVASDLDGTLLRSDGTVSTRTRRTLRRVEAGGCRIVIVTARAPLWLRDVLRDLDARHLALDGRCVLRNERAQNKAFRLKPR